MTNAYPLTFDVAYPDRPLSRLTTALRLFMAVPILVVLTAIGGFTVASTGADTTTVVASGSALLFLPPLLMVVFRGRYPRWWYEFNVELLRFQNRVGVYLALMDDRYPSTEEQQSVKLDVPYPTGLNRLLPLVKWLLAIRHYIVLAVLFNAGGAARGGRRLVRRSSSPGRFPRGLFDYPGRCPAAGQPRGPLRVCPGHRRVPAVPAARVTEIVTERLCLRPFRAADLPAFVAYRSTPEIARYQSWDTSFSQADARQFFAEQQATELGRPGDCVQLAALDRETGELCGDCAVRVEPDQTASAEIGVTLAPAHQGRGLAAEALGAVIATLFERFGIERIHAETDERNAAVHRLLERLGFRCEERSVDAEWFKGEWVSLRSYAIVRGEWGREAHGRP